MTPEKRRRGRAIRKARREFKTLSVMMAVWTASLEEALETFAKMYDSVYKFVDTLNTTTKEEQNDAQGHL